MTSSRMADPGRPAIDLLIHLVTPPSDGGVDGVDWDRFGDVLGFEAPSDYREIVARYGVGWFSGEFFVFAPGGEEGQNIYDENQTMMDIIGDPQWQESADETGEQWLNPDGATTLIDLSDPREMFAPWGGGSDGAYGFWHKVGDDPDRWPVAYTDLAGSWLYDRGGLASFLVSALTGRFPEDKIHPVVWESPEFIRFPN